MNRICPTVQEGDIYETLLIDGVNFEIHYGFYEDYERDGSEPIPVYPNLEKVPVYGVSGKRIVTHMQEPCSFFHPLNGDKNVERCCGCCERYQKNRKLISLCECKENYLENQFEGGKTI